MELILHLNIYKAQTLKLQEETIQFFNKVFNHVQIFYMIATFILNGLTLNPFQTFTEAYLESCQTSKLNFL